MPSKLDYAALKKIAAVSQSLIFYYLKTQEELLALTALRHTELCLYIMCQNLVLSVVAGRNRS